MPAPSSKEDRRIKRFVQSRNAADASLETAGKVTLFAGNSLRYELSYYAIEGHSAGKVRLSFTSAEMNTDGKTVQEPNAPKLPVRAPNKSATIRLLFLLRNS